MSKYIISAADYKIFIRVCHEQRIDRSEAVFVSFQSISECERGREQLRGVEVPNKKLIGYFSDFERNTITRKFRLQSQIEKFIIKHYSEDERPIIKGNGFDGLEIGSDREEAQAFVDFINNLVEEKK